ncbi:MAG: hypothetical protein ACI8TX_002741 [Hyphomicrobiaceae bacterium]|jgi:hypothetical protein
MIGVIGFLKTLLVTTCFVLLSGGMPAQAQPSGGEAETVEQAWVLRGALAGVLAI